MEIETPKQEKTKAVTKSILKNKTEDKWKELKNKTIISKMC